MRSSVRRLATLFFTVVSVLLGSCEETQPRGDTGPAPVDLAALAEEAPEAWAYDARTGLWSPSVFTVVAEASELYRDGRLYRVTAAGLVDRGAVAPESLDAAEQTYAAEALHWRPGPDDWVLVLGADDEAGHLPLRDVRPGDRFAYQGRIFETRASSAGSLDVRHTGEVLSSVEQTFVRQVHDVIDAAILYADGTTETIRATPDHPFYVPAHRGYVDLRDLEIGATLQVSGGGEALLVSKTWRQGDFEVFNFEVAQQHNYFVRASESEQGGLLVHNAASGAYRIKYPNGCWYVGKGLLKRALKSMAQHRPGTGIGPPSLHWVPTASPRDAFIQEAKWMDELGWESDPKKRRAKGKGKCGKAGDLMNLINSPGHRY